MLDAVLLEWEGVIADTATARREAFLRALADEGAPLEAVRSDPVLADLVALRATRVFAERLGKGCVLLPGAREFIERVQLGSRVAIVTSATRSETEFVLRLAGLDGAVATIVSADDALDPPPSTAMIERAIAQLARLRPLKRERVVAIAPTSSALRAARAAGVRTIAVGTPAHVAVDADGAVAGVDGLTLGDLARLCGITKMERRS
jgi:beta-phosphoglucomutase-like phosphatase (HAD superfamily)